MKINKISCINLSSPYGDENIFGSPSGLKSVSMVEAVDSDGIKGYGEAYPGVYAPTIVKNYVDLIAPDLIGMSINAVHVACEFPLITNKHCVSMSGIAKSVTGAIEIALWDIIAKRKNTPLYKASIHKALQPLKCYYSGGSAVLSPDQITEDVKQAISLGHNAYKMRVGLQKNDVERVGAARQALGDRKLMCDAIQSTLHSWGVNRSIDYLNKMSEYNLFWAEEFVDPSIPSDVFLLKTKTDVDLAFGESFTTLNEFYSLFQAQCLDVAQPDLCQCGGITEAMRIIAAVKKRSNCKKIAFHVWGGPVAIAANLHFAFVSQCEYLMDTWFEVPSVRLQLTEDLLNLQIEDGHVSPIEAPGLGADITDEIKEKYQFVEDSEFKDTRK